jgi:hypothetical protein
MDHVSRPLIALLLGTVAVFALWIVALKPSTSGGGAGSKPGAYVSAIAKAHQAVALSAAASVARGGTVAASPSAHPAAAAQTSAITHTPAAAQSSHPTAKATHPASTIFKTGTTWPAQRTSTSGPARRASAVARALKKNETVALLFYNAAGTDDRAVRRELAAVPAHRGRVLSVAVPLNELARYGVVTNQVMVNVSPTLVLIDKGHQASTIVGFADRFEIAQRVADALAAP